MFPSDGGCAAAQMPERARTVQWPAVPNFYSIYTTRAPRVQEPYMVLPDYHGRSLVNLMSSLAIALGGEAQLYPPLHVLAPSELQRSRNIVLLVIDGLGYDYLQEASRAGPFAQRLRAPVTSVFPSTTASAITTFLTGTAPQQHGLTGWHMYFREIGSVITVLPFRPRHGGASLSEAGVTVQALLGPTSFFDRIPARSFVVGPQRIIHSDFNVTFCGSAERRSYSSLPEMFHAMAGIVQAGGERRYVYAYWPELDGLAHEHGVGSRKVAEHLAEIETAFDAFVQRIRGSNTTVVVTADHGFIDTAPEMLIELDAHPVLSGTLTVPLCGERRLAYCYVRAGREAEFERYVGERLGEYVDVHQSQRLVDEGYFGLGPPHPRLVDRIGDYTLIMKRNAVIKDWVVGERRYTQIGVHGGVSGQEMYVPLIVATA